MYVYINVIYTLANLHYLIAVCNIVLFVVYLFTVINFIGKVTHVYNITNVVFVILLTLCCVVI